LIGIAWPEAPGLPFHQHVEIKVSEYDSFLAHLDHTGQEATSVVEKLVGINLPGNHLAWQVVESMTVAVLGLHILHLIPEIVLEFDVALVQVGDVTQELVAVVILRFYSTSTGLETHV